MKENCEVIGPLAVVNEPENVAKDLSQNDCLDQQTPLFKTLDGSYASNLKHIRAQKFSGCSRNTHVLKYTQ